MMRDYKKFVKTAFVLGALSFAALSFLQWLTGARFAFYFTATTDFFFYFSLIALILLILSGKSEDIENRLRALPPKIAKLIQSIFFASILAIAGFDLFRKFGVIDPFSENIANIIKTIFIIIAIPAGVFSFWPKQEKNGLTKESKSKQLLIQFFNKAKHASKKYDLHKIGLIAILLIGSVLRLINLGKLGYSTDEGSTALYSYYINNSGLPCADAICYLRGLPYLYFASLFTKIFGVTEFWVRFPGVLITMGTLVILYFLVKKITANKTIALLAVTLITFADWHFMLGRYARMYGFFLFFVILSFYFYIKTFHENNSKYIIPLILSIIFALLTHQLGMLLVFFVALPLLTNKLDLYKNKCFILFCFMLLASVFLSFTKLPGIIYTDPNYLSLYDVHPEYRIIDKFWYLNHLQKPNWTFIKDLFRFFPLAATILSSYLLYIVFDFRRQNTIKNIFVFFIVFAFIIMAIYKIQYVPKYLWWLLVVIYIPLSTAIYYIYKNLSKKIATLIVLTLLLGSSIGIQHILSRNYGEDETRFPILMSTHVESYHPDDKTPIEFLKNNYQSGDIIISDYWMQNVYMKILMNRQSDYHISRLNYDEFLKKYPYYKLYIKNESWRLGKTGPFLIHSTDELILIINQHANKRIWYISGADFDKKKFLSISNKPVDDFIKANYSNKIVYTAKDNNSKVYLINQ